MFVQGQSLESLLQEMSTVANTIKPGYYDILSNLHFKIPKSHPKRFNMQSSTNVLDGYESVLERLILNNVIERG